MRELWVSYCLLAGMVRLLSSDSSSVPVEQDLAGDDTKRFPAALALAGEEVAKAQVAEMEDVGRIGHASTVFLPVQVITDMACSRYPLGTFCFSQSARNFFRPRSVSGCCTSCLNTVNGIVQMSPPIFAASTTCIGFRTLATRTFVLYW